METTYGDDIFNEELVLKGLKLNIKKRFNDFIELVILYEKDIQKQAYLIKYLVKRIKMFEYSKDGMLSALMFLESVLTNFEYNINLINKSH